MTRVDDVIYEKVLRVETKDIFVDVKRNKNGVYLKISERNGANRSTVLIPASGAQKLRDALDEVVQQTSGLLGVARQRKERVVNPEVKTSVVYVSGLPWSTTEQELAHHMSSAGNVIRSVILKKGNRRSIGCGIVEYDTHEIALNAISTMNDTELDGRKIHCREDRDLASPAEADYRRGPGTGSQSLQAVPVARKSFHQGDTEPKQMIENRVFCSNLSWQTSGETLASYFSVFGTVTKAEILTAKNGRSLGSGFVEFSEAVSVPQAIAQLNNQDLDGRTITVREYYA